MAVADLWPLIKVRGGQRPEVDVGGGNVELGVVEGNLLVVGGVFEYGGALRALGMNENGGFVGEPVDPETMAGEGMVAEAGDDGDGVAEVVVRERCGSG